MSSSPATATTSSVAPSTVPLAVDDILAQLPAVPHTPHSTESVDASYDAAVLPLTSSVASLHRVQFAIRGRRYETTMEVAVTYCLAFHAFFRMPFANGTTVGDVAEAADTAPSDDALMAHYVDVVEPLLHTFLQQEMQKSTEAEDAAAFVPPPLPRPVSISYDAATHVWKFEFLRRLSPEAEDEERRRRQDLSGAEAEKHITADELNASPYLLLQNDFVGVLLVYLRRCAKVRAEATAAAATAASAAPAAAYPVLPIRWGEMSYDDQISFLQVLRAFGVVPLTGTYTRPTAALSTSMFVGADAATVAAVAKAEGEACSLRVKAEEFRLLQQQQQESDEARCAQRASRKADDYDDDDGVVLAATGCARCGMAGHPTEACPY